MAKEDADKDAIKAVETRHTTHTTTKKWNNKETESDEEKAKSVNIESDNEGDEMNQPSTPTEAATAPQLIVPISKQDHEINQLIDDLTKSDDEDEEVPINLLK
ncbi:hypothetical protein J1N35_004713 [Gossypium stocksii]|uniref:Uncharacterized protein n=1 Tax=Gossypium stocksii TaxID=47602 RepID=A0A9D3WE58_9ROSI|nr:hypothetical protein J1N35_004713 [Gossypium stocksii]